MDVCGPPPYGARVRSHRHVHAAALLAALSGACASTAALHDTPSARTARYLESIRGEGAQEAAFWARFVGALCHEHASARPSAQQALQWLLEGARGGDNDGRCD